MQCKKSSVTKLVLLILFSFTWSLSATFATAHAAASGGINDMTALDALGIDTSPPAAFEPHTTNNPYGRQKITLADVSELFIVGRAPIGWQYDSYAQLYGNNWPVNGKTSEFMNRALKMSTPGREQSGGTYGGQGSKYILDERDGIIPCAPTALAMTEGDFDLKSGGQKSLVAYVGIWMDGYPLNDTRNNMRIGFINPVNMYNADNRIESGSINLWDCSLLFNKEDLKIEEKGNLTYQTFINDYVASQYTKIAAGDFDGDGVDEIAIYVPDREDPRIEIYKLQNRDNKWKPDKEPRWALAMTYALDSYRATKAVINKYNVNGKIYSLSSGVGETLAPNVVSLAAADFNKDGVDDLVISWSYLGEAMTTLPPTRAVMLFGDRNGDMLTRKQEFELNAGSDSITRASFATGDIDGDGQTELILGGSLAKSDPGKPSRYVAIYKWNGSSFVISQSENFELFKKDDNGNYVNVNVPKNKTKFYSLPVAPANLTVGRFGGLTEPMYIYIDSILISLGDNGMEIVQLLDERLADDTFPYSEWGARAADIVGNGVDTVFSMRVKLPDEYINQELEKYKNIPFLYNMIKMSLNKVAAGIKRYEMLFELDAIYESNGDLAVKRWKDNGSGGLAFCLPNTDNDTIQLTYTGKHKYTYSDPKILAVLASPPYFKDLDNPELGDSWSSTSYGSSKGTGSGTNTSHTLSVGLYTSWEKEVKIFRITLFKAEAEFSLNNKMTWATTTSSTLEQSVAYDTFQGQDTVVLFSIPIETYEYEARVPILSSDNSISGYEVQTMTVNIPHEASVRNLPLDTYERIAVNFDGLPKIAGQVLDHTLGIPGSYPRNSGGYSRWMNKSASLERFFNPMKFPFLISSGNPAAVGFGASSQSKEIVMSKETETSFNYELEIETKFGVGGGSVMVGVTAGYSFGTGTVDISTEGSAFRALVYAMPEAGEPYGYNFNWHLFVYPYVDEANCFPVVTYIITDVTQPPLLPDNFKQEEDGTTQRQIALTWEHSGNPSGFTIYRFLRAAGAADFYEVAHISAGDMDYITSIDGNTRVYRYIDEGLSPDTEYQYKIQTVGQAVPSLSIPSATLEAYTKPDGKIPVVGLTETKMTVYPDTPAIVSAYLLNESEMSSAVLYYQWQKLSEKKNEWKDLAAVTTQTLYVKDAGLDDAGQYRCRVSSLEDQTIVSVYSPELTLEYSLRDVQMENLSVNGNIASVNIIGVGTNLIPSGTVVFYLTGTNSAKDFGVTIDPSGVASVELSAIDGVYKVTAAYSGNRVFKPAQIGDRRVIQRTQSGGRRIRMQRTARQNDFPVFFNAGGVRALTFWDYSDTYRYGDDINFIHYLISAESKVVSADTLNLSSVINGGRNIFRRVTIYDIFYSNGAISDNINGYLALKCNATGAHNASNELYCPQTSYMSAARDKVIPRFEQNKAGWVGDYYIPYDLNGDGRIENSARIALSSGEVLSIASLSDSYEGFIFSISPVPISVDFSEEMKNIVLPYTSITESKLAELTDNANSLQVLGNLQFNDTAETLLAVVPSESAPWLESNNIKYTFPYQMWLDKNHSYSNINNSFRGITASEKNPNEGINIFSSHQRGGYYPLSSYPDRGGATPGTYTLSLGDVYYANKTQATAPNRYTTIPSVHIIQNYDIAYGNTTLHVTGPASPVTASAVKVNGLNAGTIAMVAPSTGLERDYPTGTEFVFVAEPHYSYVVDHWKVNGKQINNLTNMLKYVQTQDGAKVEAFFKVKQNALTYAADPANSMVNGQPVVNAIVSVQNIPSGNVVTTGANMTFTAREAEGWHFKSWECFIEGGATQYGYEKTFATTMPNENVRLFAKFERDAYNLTLGNGLVAVDTRGRELDTAKPITGDTKVTVRPAVGWSFKPDSKWIVNGAAANVIDENYSFVLLEDTNIDCDVEAGQYKVTALVDGAGGYVIVTDRSGRLLNEHVLTAVTGGTELIFTALPEREYSFNKWSVSSADETQNNTARSARRTARGTEAGNIYTCFVSGNMEVSVSFQQKASRDITMGTDKHAELAFAVDNEPITRSDEGTITLYEDEILIAAAAPKPRWMMAGWDVNGVYIPTLDNTYLIAYSDDIRTLAPVTQPLTYNMLTFAAVPEEGYNAAPRVLTAKADGFSINSDSLVGGGSELSFAFGGVGETVTNWTVGDYNGEVVAMNEYGYPLVSNALFIDGTFGRSHVTARYDSNENIGVPQITAEGMRVSSEGTIVKGMIVTVTVPAPSPDESLIFVTADYGQIQYDVAPIIFDDATFRGFDAVSRNDDGSYKCVIGSIPGDVTVTAVKSHIASLVVNKDDAAWINHGKKYTLRLDSDESVTANMTSMGITTTAKVSNGIWKVYDGATDTGARIIISDANGNATLDYYTISYSVVNDRSVRNSAINATYNDKTLSKGSVVLGGKRLVITTTVTGSAKYNYAWSGAGTSGQTTNAITINPLSGTINATCTVSRDISAASAELVEGNVWLLQDENRITWYLTAYTKQTTETGAPSVVVREYYSNSQVKKEIIKLLMSKFNVEANVAEALYFTEYSYIYSKDLKTYYVDYTRHYNIAGGLIYGIETDSLTEETKPKWETVAPKGPSGLALDIVMKK